MDNVNYAPQELRIVNRQQNETAEEIANLYESLDHNQTAKAKGSYPQLQLGKQAATLALIIILQVLMLIVLIAILVTVYMPTHSCTNVIYSNGNDSNGCALSNSSNIPVKQLDPMETAEFFQKIDKMAHAFSNVSNACISSADVVYELSSTMQKILLKQNNISFDPLLNSCSKIKKMQLYSQSGYYTINGKSIYCHMGELCGTDTWARLAYLNMSDPTQNCPSGFRLYQSGGVRACGRPVTNDGSCVSVQFPSNGIKYSQICGRVVGYQYGTTDAAKSSVMPDGVTITRGLSQQNVWTMLAGSFDSSLNNPHNRCPCSTNSGQVVLSDHYFCESGKHDTLFEVKLYTSDPLWDGQGCGSNEALCCSAPGIPWFHRDYGNTTTTDYIELKICCNEGTDNEDSPVNAYEIYVK